MKTIPVEEKFMLLKKVLHEELCFVTNRLVRTYFPEMPVYPSDNPMTVEEAITYLRGTIERIQKDPEFFGKTRYYLALSKSDKWFPYKSEI